MALDGSSGGQASASLLPARGTGVASALPPRNHALQGNRKVRCFAGVLLSRQGRFCLRRISGDTRGKEDTPMLFVRKERGQGLVEYALIIILVAVVVLVILSILGPAIGNIFSQLIPQI
jgi:pilus assembly protein Flp/PilA